MDISRRGLLQTGALTALAAATLSAPIGTLQRTAEAKSASRLPDSLMPRPFRTAFARPPVAVPDWTGYDDDGAPVEHYTITQKPGAVQLVAGLLTPVYGYDGSLPGPTISVEQGTRVQVRMRNQMPATHPSLGHPFTTSTHLHGSASLPEYDGYASDVTFPGYVKTYHYPNFQQARTLWYHDHGVHHTAENAYGGLAAQYHMHDPTERALLPQGDFDVPLTINDIMLAANGSLGYDDNSHSGLYGDIMLVNGRPWPVMKVQRRVYRFRILNASISRALRLSLSTGDPVWFVATDGGLMPRSRPVTTWRHGGAERYEVLVDFSRYAPGQRVELRNGSLPNVVDYDYTNRVMAFDVTDEPVDTSDPTWRTIPQTLVDSPVMRLTERDAVRTRNLRLHKDSSGRWVINGTTWDDVIASGYQKVVADPAYGDVEVWEIENRSGGWFHPLHIHLVDFRVLSRNGRAPFDNELGPKDVVVVGENERVRLVMRFEHQRGRYMVHCHNLPHEDHDMMTQFSVGMKGQTVDPHDPITADPCQPDPDTE
jgi:spore coat protein A